MCVRESEKSEMGNFLSGAQRAASGGGTGSAQPERPGDLDSCLWPVWARVVDALPVGVVGASDVELLRQLCEALYVQAQCWRSIVESGVLTEDKAHGGDVRRNPAVMTWRQAADTARQCMALMGMSPVARQRMQDDGPQVDEFDQFLTRRHG